jgi:acyl-CoA synthetase (AMP-forming)/AMP-acid ligase II
MSPTPLQALLNQARSRAEDTAFIFHGDVWTYRDLADESERIAHGLAANGVKPGDRVALHMLNRPEIIVAYYACYRLGAIAAPLRSTFTFAELAPLLQRLRPALYIGETALYPNVAPADAAILPPSRRILVDDHAGTHGVRAWDVLKQAAPVQLPTPSIREPAVLINTSGTTSGQPKFVAHTPSTLGAIADLICKYQGWSADDMSVSPLTMVHASGVFRSLALIQCGAPFLVLESFDADAVLDNVERYRGTCLFGPPAQHAALVQAQRARPRDLSSLRFGTTGSDACPIALQEEATSVLGAPIYNLWASTESVGSLTFGLRPGPVSRVVEGAQIRLVDDHGADVPHGEIGELLIRGPNVFIGYWGDPAATAQSLRDGWLYTGDMMRRGDGDEIWFVARKKDIIIRSGTNISPIEVEEALVASHPAVKEAAVVGKPDPVLGQRVFAFIKLAANAKTSVVSEILGKVGQRLAAYKVPEDLIVLQDLPRNALSKIDRVKLKAMLCETGPAGG